jgi:hypothetical protein
MSQESIYKELQNKYDPAKATGTSEGVYSKYKKAKQQETRRNLEMTANNIMYRIENVFTDDVVIPPRRDLKSDLINVTFGQTTNAGCEPGYEKCLGTNYCEVPKACACPEPTEALTSYQQVIYDLYTTKCAVQTFNAEGWLTDTINCWKRYKTHDASNPFNVITDQLSGSTNVKIYCFPLIDPEQLLFDAIPGNYSLRNSLASSYCENNSTNNLMDCICPGYLSGVYSYNGYFIKDVGYYVYVRLSNGLRVFASIVPSFINLILFGIIDPVWSPFFKAFNAPVWLYSLFSIEFALSNISCAVPHLGSFSIFIIFCWLLKNIYWDILLPVISYWCNDVHFIGLVLLNQDVKIDNILKLREEIPNHDSKIWKEIKKLKNKQKV